MVKKIQMEINGGRNGLGEETEDFSVFVEESIEKNREQ